VTSSPRRSKLDTSPPTLTGGVQASQAHRRPRRSEGLGTATGIAPPPLAECKGLLLTQVLANGTDLSEVARLEVAPGTFQRLQRVFDESAHRRADVRPGEVWIDAVASNDTLLADPLVISANQAVWLLRDYFHVSARAWRRIREGEGLTQTGGANEPNPS
jgi:hypothetical protein